MGQGPETSPSSCHFTKPLEVDVKKGSQVTPSPTPILSSVGTERTSEGISSFVNMYIYVYDVCLEERNNVIDTGEIIPESLFTIRTTEEG